MERVKSNKKKLSLLTLLYSSLLVILLAGCGDGNTAIEQRWQEQIQLHDGTILWIDRTANYIRKSREFGIFGGEGGAVSKMTVSIKVPANTIAPSPPIWKFNAVPIVLDYDKAKQTWFIVASYFYCDSSVDANNPPLKQWQYEVVDNKWVIVPLNKELLGRPSNLFINFDNEKIKLKKIFLKDIERDRKSLHSDMYKKVINVPNRCFKG